MNDQITQQCVYLPGAEHPGMPDIAHAMFARNAGYYADPALTELAWVDPKIREFWEEQALAVRDDLEHLARHGHLPT